MEFVEDGSAAFSSKKYTKGLFSNVRSVVLVKGPQSDGDLEEKAGYYGEDLVLNMVEMDLGTCWVCGTYDKSVFTVPSGETLLGVIVVGKVDKPNLKEKTTRKLIHKNDKSLNERLLSTSRLSSWTIQGAHAVLLAPNASNKQRVTINVKNDVMTIDVPGDLPTDMIDLGIAKRHFDSEAAGHFDSGNHAEFHPEEGKDPYQVLNWH